MCSDKPNSEANEELDLWSALLHAKGVECQWDGSEPLPEEMFLVEEDPGSTISYPWNPTSPESEAYFTQLEQNFSLDDWETEEIATRSTAFFNGVSSLWSVASLQSSLGERFASRIPQQLLGAIATQAKQVLTTSQSLADQLVQCVEGILPNLAQEDLLVLARPLAYAMRNGESRHAVDATLEKVRSVSWEELSDVEQARLSLAVARCALAELEIQEQE